jgi:hypothetical protein
METAKVKAAKGGILTSARMRALLAAAVHEPEVPATLVLGGSRSCG